MSLQELTPEPGLEQIKDRTKTLPELQKLVEQHSQELAALTQKFADQNLRFELKYYEVANWQQEVQHRLAGLSNQPPAAAPATTEPDPAVALKKLEEEYRRLQNWAQDLEGRLKQIQGSPLYRILGRFIGR